jgi:predicted RNase H-like HicB family nuclease
MQSLFMVTRDIHGLRLKGRRIGDFHPIISHPRLRASADVQVINKKWEIIMKAEFTAILEPAPEGGFWAICPEVPGANGQGETIEEAKNSLRDAIELILEDRKADILRGLPDDAIQEKVMVG